LIVLNDIALDDFIIDSIRLLILISVFKDKKSFKLTDTKIKLFDYYLKFPATMLEEESVKISLRKNFDEYYAFFHWKPDIVRYRKTINYLLAKDLIIKEAKENDNCYIVTDKGIELINSMHAKYKNDLSELSLYIEKNISKMSDTKIEEEILRRTNLLKRVLEE
jgi:hypothetical protein